jgi:hypothetical protein
MPGWNRLINQSQINSIQNTVGEVEEKADIIEEHLHNSDIWFGNNAGNAEEDNLTPFTLVSGNNDFGPAVPLLDTNDTPFRAGRLSFDLRKFGITRLESATAYYVRFIWGTGSSAEAIAAQQYTTEFIIRITAGTVSKGSPVIIEFPRIAVETKVWAQCKNATNLDELDILPSCHEYDDAV